MRTDALIRTIAFILGVHSLLLLIVLGFIRYTSIEIKRAKLENKIVYEQMELLAAAKVSEAATKALAHGRTDKKAKAYRGVLNERVYYYAP